MEAEVFMEIKEIIHHRENGLFSPTCCIYRVPHTIHHLKEDACTPKAVSVGPFHHGSDLRLFDMEMYKQVFFKRFSQQAKTSWSDLVRFVRHLESKVRASYSEKIKLIRKELVKTILVDDSFIMDAKLSQPWLRVTKPRSDDIQFQDQTSHDKFTFTCKIKMPK
ncbi:hypothetical protein QN277_001895 [Acacia crassicarpa]|uniref:Uncharacterized protein n=1 Tax=Acacia crassicarpa TaxID=499986 RepID=A0AAE1N9L4_9FABA|nr:hypothetical protein QN277_001895 [Acacia crassicarpa]